MAGFTSDKLPFIDLEELPGEDCTDEINQNEDYPGHNASEVNQFNDGKSVLYIDKIT